MRDHLDPVATRVALEHRAHDRSLGLHDQDARALRLADPFAAVAVGQPARRESALDPPAQPAARVLFDLAALLGVDDAHDPRAEAAELLAGARLEPGSSVLLELVQDPTEVLLVAREPR